MAEHFILFSSVSGNEERSGAGTFGAPAVCITAPAPVEEYIAPQTGVVEEENVKKVIELLQTIPIRVRAALAQLRQGTKTEESEGVVLRVDQPVASEAKRLHSEGLLTMVAHIAADLSAKVTLLIKDMIARLNLFAESETKRLHCEGLQLLAVHRFWPVR